MTTVQTQTSPVKRTRADVYRERVQIRLATDEAGPLIAEVLRENNIEIPGTDWSKVFPHWLIATVDDSVIGCMMVMPGKPFGHGGFLCVRPSAGFKMRAIAIRKLVHQAVATCHYYGSSYVIGMVDGRNQKFYDVLTKMGFTAISPHMAMMKRIKD